ncbi:MAG: suppressor of fused domain protein [Bacteroidota bacterium]
MKFLKNLFSGSGNSNQEPEILLEARSPLCPIHAVVEQDDRVAYMYLGGQKHSPFGTKACWIRNLQPAPEEIETGLMEDGIAPMMPQAFCKFPDGQKPLEKEDLEIVWSEEGDAAALFIKGEVAVIIPGWSGQGGFWGYARDAIEQGPYAWELTEKNEYPQRIKAARSSWEMWTRQHNPFDQRQRFILDMYKETFGPSDTYFAIDGGEWPPRGLYVRTGEARTVLATVGLSLHPMPMIEMYTEDRFKYHRIELGLILNEQLPSEQIEKLASWISGQATIPWSNITFLGEGHTLYFPTLGSSHFKAVLLTNRLDKLPAPELEPFQNSPINFLWMIPLSERERNEVMENGSVEIVEKLNNIGEAVFSLSREEVI